MTNKVPFALPKIERKDSFIKLKYLTANILLIVTAYKKVNDIKAKKNTNKMLKIKKKGVFIWTAI